MTPYFGYGNSTESSSTSENLFNELKNRVFKHKTLPIRLDEFVQNHVSFIMGSMKLIKGKPEYNNSKDDQSEKEQKKEHKKEHSDNSIGKHHTYDNINEVENWRGQGKPAKNMKKNYSTPDRSILFYNDSSKTKFSIIGILRNGNIQDLKSIMVDGTNYSLTNTCTFDSIFQILCSSYTDSVKYAQFIDLNTSKTLYILVANAIRDGINVQSYKKRANILTSIFLKVKENTQLRQLPGGLIYLDCASTANFLIKNLFDEFPSFKEQITCTNCDFEKISEGKTIIANLPTDTIDFLQDVLNSRFTNYTSMCEMCESSETKIDFTFGNHIFIEICAPTSERQRYVQHFDLSLVLSTLPQKITISNESFTLRGVISFIAPISKGREAIGHYVSYCWCEMDNSWNRYDDLQRTPRTVRHTTIEAGCQFIVYTI